MSSDEEASQFFCQRYRNHPEMNDDMLKTLLILGSKIFEKCVCRAILIILLLVYILSFILQIFYFLINPSLSLLIQYGSLFLQLSWSTLNIIYLLLYSKLIYKVMSFIKLWTIDTAGYKIKKKIEDEAKKVNKFAILASSISLLCAATNVLSDDFKQLHYWGLAYKLTIFLATFPMLASGYQLIYPSTQVRFQMYMFIKLIKDIDFGFDEKNLSLIHDQLYQKEIEFRLKVLIKRHCDFLQWRTNTVNSMNHLIIPFSIGGCFIFFSLVLYLFQIMVEFKILYVFRTLFAIITANSIFWGIIICGQNFENQSEKVFNELMFTNWYNWNLTNRKLFIIILNNSIKPIKINYREQVTVNNTLALSIFKYVYSIINFFLNLQLKK